MAIHDRLEQEAKEAEEEVLNTETEESTEDESVEEVEEETKEETQDYETEAKLYKQRYEVLQGKYNAEVPRMQEKIRELESLEEETDDDDDLDFASKKDIETLRSEMAAGRFITALDSLVPKWRQIDQDQDFLRWLSETDALSGMQRQQMLNDAEATGDAQRVATIIQSWQAVTRPPKADLRRKITPDNAAGKRPRGKPTYTQAFADQFYRDMRQGKYRDKEAEAQQIERDLFAAEREGRLV